MLLGPQPPNPASLSPAGFSRGHFAALLLTIDGWHMIAYLLATFWFSTILAVWGFMLAGPWIGTGSTGGALPWWILGL
jgi:hypothetical protein